VQVEGDVPQQGLFAEDDGQILHAGTAEAVLMHYASGFNSEYQQKTRMSLHRLLTTDN